MSGIAVSRRGFLGTGVGWLGAAALGLGQEPGRRARTVSILHTTDLHGHLLPTQTYEGLADVGGFARVATCLRRWRRELPHSLLVDAGDLYQGTPASLMSEGRLMVGLLNRLGYDAWTLGNHDFDWGPEATEANLALSSAPVLTANLDRAGRRPGSFEGAWEKVRPWTIREVGGFRIGLVGMITPGLPFWLTPETLGGTLALDPVETLRQSVAELQAEGVDAIVLISHMGWRFQDDFANPLREMLRESRGVDVCIAGHSHQNQPSWTLHNAICTQASYHGIHCGRVDLTFDLETRRLVGKQAFTLLMDDRFEPDPAVMEAAQPELKAAEEQLARPIGRVRARIPGEGRGSPLANLMCEIFAEAVKREGSEVDGVFHGTFASGDLEPGELTVADAWRIVPYENVLVTAELSADELVEIVREDADHRRSDRTLWPFDLALDPQGQPARFLFRGEPVARDRRFRIAFNSYDSQSGGQRLMRLRDILAQPQARRRTVPVDTRGALIDGILNRGEIG